MIESALLQLLTGISGLSSSPVSGRVYPGVLPENCAYPAVTFTAISTPVAERTSKKTQHTTRRTLFQVDVWSATYLQAGQIAGAIFTAIDGYSGEVAGTPIKLVEVEDNRPSHDSASEYHRRTLEISMLHP